MATPDAIRLVQDAIASVCDQYDVEYDWTRYNRHLAVEIIHNGKRVKKSYSAGDPRAHHNIKAEFRRILESMGVPFKAPSPTKVGKAEENNSMNHFQSTPGSMEDLKENLSQASEALPIEQPEPVAKAHLNDSDYVLYEPKLLVGNKFIVVELQKDIVAEAGSVLAIPLNKVNTVLTFTREQFDALFDVVQPSQERQDALTLSKTDKPIDIVENQPIEPKPVLASNPKEIEPLDLTMLGCQVTRLLTGMAYLTVKEGHKSITAEMMKPLMVSHDQKQFGARMPKLEMLGCVRRIGPKPGGARGWVYEVTPLGLKTAEANGADAWIRDNMAPPAWSNY